MATDEKKKAFIEALSLSGSVSSACLKADISRTTYYKWRKADHAFAEACDFYIGSFAESKAVEREQRKEEQRKQAKAIAETSRIKLDAADLLARYTGKPGAQIVAEVGEELRAALKEDGKYKKAFEPAIRVVAEQFANAIISGSARDRYDPLQIEFTSTGSPKLATNPILKQTSELWTAAMRGLKQLGLCYDPKDEGGEDYMSSFMKQFKEDD